MPGPAVLTNPQDLDDTDIKATVVKIKILEKPKEAEEPHKIFLTKGENLTLTCEVFLPWQQGLTKNIYI